MHGVVWGGMWTRHGMVCQDVVEWFDVNHGVCEMWCDVESQLQFQTWRDVVCDWNAKCVMWNKYVVWNMASWYVECCIMQDVESYNVMWSGVELWWKRMWHMQYAVWLLWDVRCRNVVVWHKIKLWWCNVEYGMVVVWNVLWCWMWVWCGIVVGVEWCEMWTERRDCCDIKCGVEHVVCSNVM